MEFHGSPEASVGVEYELHLLDGESLDLADGILPLLELTQDDPHVVSEYNQSTVEIKSDVASEVHRLEAHLFEQVARLRDKCDMLGMKICGGATHPFCTRLAAVTPLPRYREIEAATGYAGAIQMVCATHVHIGMRSGQEAVQMMRRVRPYLPVLLAISASSPFYMGVDTRFAAYRPRILLAAHSYGTPPEVNSWEQFEAIWNAARRANVYQTFKDMHWDIRPKPEYGTLEVRIMDGQPTVYATAALVSLVHSLVDYLEHYRAECDPPPYPDLPVWLEVENAYRAAHQALDAPLIISPEGDTRCMRDVAMELTEILRPAAVRLGEMDYMEFIRRSIENGPSYVRQRAIYKDTGSLVEVTASLLRELDDELAGRCP